MRSFFITIIGVIFYFTSSAQNNYPVPEGYSVHKNFENKPFKIQKDFDGDAVEDLAIVYAKTNAEDENVVAIYLSTKYNSSKTYYYFPFSSNSYNLEFKNNVLIVGSCFGTGRYCKTLKFKYYSSLKNMRLIGYDEESFGNAVHDGAYFKSVNLLTSKYDLSGAKWKSEIVKSIKLPLITLDRLDEKNLDFLESIGRAYID